MSEGDQTVVPASFIALFLRRGSGKLRETREVVAARYELCEDMAQMLTETALTRRFELSVTESDVLERIGRGLEAEGSMFSTDETGWVLCRLAELLQWPMPSLPPRDDA
jgi:hypothetical protein